jgi:hypothetical protein
MRGQSHVSHLSLLHHGGAANCLAGLTRQRKAALLLGIRKESDGFTEVPPAS